LDREARIAFAAFVNENAGMYEPLQGPLRSALAKLPAYAARIALVLHVAETPPEEEPGPVSVGAMARAVRLVRWFRSEAGRLYAAYGLLESGLPGAAPDDRDTRLVRELPGQFTAAHVQSVWGVGRTSAYDTIRRLIRRRFVEDAG